MEETTAYVTVHTPYLLGMPERMTPEEIEVEIRRGKYDPNETFDTKLLKVGKFDVHVVKHYDAERILPRVPDLAVIGCAGDSEDFVKEHRRLGMLFARYSICYGERSRYSDELPEETGYSLDLPKSPAMVKRLLHYEPFIEALLAREETPIRAALESFSESEEELVLATPYLSEALKVRELARV